MKYCKDFAALFKELSGIPHSGTFAPFLSRKEKEEIKNKINHQDTKTPNFKKGKGIRNS